MFFFFSSRRRHTRFWRDWSSDVCSSDLLDRFGVLVDDAEIAFVRRPAVLPAPRVEPVIAVLEHEPIGAALRGDLFAHLQEDRSEERRVGKECRSRWSPYH